METIKVRILEDGKTAVEVNPLGEEPCKYNSEKGFIVGHSITSQWMEWQEVEQNLRTFEIAFANIGESEDIGDGYKITEISICKLISDSIHTAQILETGKIRII